MLPGSRKLLSNTRIDKKSDALEYRPSGYMRAVRQGLNNHVQRSLLQ